MTTDAASYSIQRVMLAPEVYEYEEGTLTLTIINTAGDNLILHGKATGIIEPNRSIEV